MSAISEPAMVKWQKWHSWVMMSTNDLCGLVFSCKKYIFNNFRENTTKIINDVHREKLFYSTQDRNYWNRSLAAFDLIHMFTQAIKYYTFHCHILKTTGAWAR